MRIKFETAQDLFVAFPTLQDDVEAKASEAPPLDFTKQLASSETPEDCLSFFAYLAPRREAVWWGCRCLHALGTEDPDGALAAADAWVADPEEAQRVAALQIAETTGTPDQATWIAFAAGWSGGNIAGTDQPAPVSAPPYLTAKAVRAAVLIAVSRAPFRERRARLERCLDEAIAVANDDIDEHFD